MIDVAPNLEGLIVMPDKLDSDIWKLNCKNGVVDIKTGELFPHKQEYYIRESTIMSKFALSSLFLTARHPDGLSF